MEIIAYLAIFLIIFVVCSLLIQLIATKHTDEKVLIASIVILFCFMVAGVYITTLKSN